MTGASHAFKGDARTAFAVNVMGTLATARAKSAARWAGSLDMFFDPRHRDTCKFCFEPIESSPAAVRGWRSLPYACEIRTSVPYSLDRSPIEQVFAKRKTLLRRTAARTRESLWDVFGALLESFSPAECANCIRHCGYGG